jgi:hypothetical protein
VGRVGGGLFFTTFETGMGTLGVPKTCGDGGGGIFGRVEETYRLNIDGGAPRPPG